MSEMETKRKDIFNTLQAIDCSEHVEQKNGLSYLSWAWAWGIAKSLYPRSYYTIYENKDGWIYFTDGKTCWVKTGVTIVDGDYSQEHIEYLPVMNFKNASIPAKDITSTDANKAIQRSLTKALARHGLGLYIYAGEDLPMEGAEDFEEKARQAEEAKRKVAELKKLQAEVDEMAKKKVADMDAQQKRAYFETKVKPIVGSMNYLQCSDPEKLKKLLTELKAA